MAAPAAPAALVDLDADRRIRPLTQALALAGRSARSTARQPEMWLPSLIFPLMIAAVNNSAMARAVNLPGFPPVDSVLQFLLPATIVQGVMFGAVSGGSDLALDIENGFFERLLASPVARPAILVGRLAGGAVLGASQTVVFVALFALFGARVEGGPLAVVALMGMAVAVTLMVGGVTAAVGIRTGSQESVDAAFPLIFILLFMSSAFFPAELMSGWFQWMAVHNPLSWMIDAARRLVIYGFDWSDAVEAVAVPAAISVLTIALAVRQMQKRLERDR
ncbi:MAG TPA: ABC transporter permease [Acidimicrobiales bacterium]|nr:ABC transporter permease [Acidimicrobiales bacterium]